MKIPSPTRTEVIVDLRHKFDFDPTFQNVHLHSDCELKFFCETFSMIDAMRRVDLLHDFSQHIQRTNGVIDCEQIVQLLRGYDLIKDKTKTTEGFHFLLDSIYLIVKEIVVDRFVSCMRTSTLGCIAWEIGELYKEKHEGQEGSDNEQELETNNNFSIQFATTDEWKEKAHAWQGLAKNLQELAKYQHGHMKIHHDFQKSNYAEDPRTKSVYFSTFLAIFFGIFYLILRNCRVESRELTRLLKK